MFRPLINSGVRTVIRTQTRQAHIVANPLETLKQSVQKLEVNSDLQSHLVDLHEKYHPTVDQWIGEQESLIHQGGASSDNVHARAAAEAFTLSSAIHETSGFLLKYDVRIPGISLRDSIKPFHRDRLTEDFQTAFKKLSEAKKIQVLLCAEPGVIEKMGITSFPISEQEIAKRRQHIPAGLLLTEPEFLATLDYLNSDTHLFAALNNAGRSKAYYNIPLFADAVQGVSAELKSGLEKLSLHPLFKRTDIVVYKGVMMSTAGGAYRRAALDEKLANGGFIYFPHTMSGSEKLEQSYTYSKSPSEYNVLLNIKIKQGAAVDVLHDTYTVGQHEVVTAEGMRCRINRKSEELIPDLVTCNDACVTIYELEQF